jgi:hypothetical protein
MFRSFLKRQNTTDVRNGVLIADGPVKGKARSPRRVCKRGTEPKSLLDERLPVLNVVR